MMPDTPNATGAAEAAAREHATYLLFILLVSVLALVVLAADLAVDHKSETGQILNYADWMLCALFFADFLYCLWNADHKLKYLLTWGWLDLASSIPQIETLRWGRASRVVRVLRVLRGVRSARILMRFVLEKRAESALMAATLASIVIIAISSIMILHVEPAAGEGANIRTAEDALWWSVVTIATVGYGDHYPVTSEGRIVAAVLMASGVGLIGTWSGIAASWFLAASNKDQDEDVKALRREIRELRRLVESQRRESS